MPRGRARLKAAYTIPELAGMMPGMSRYQVRRMLEHNQVEFVWTGRKILVFLSELKRGMPQAWETIMELMALDRDDDD